MTDKRDKPEKGLKQSDLDLWQRFVRDINPLKKTGRTTADTQPVPGPAKAGSSAEQITIPVQNGDSSKPRSRQPPQLDRRTEDKLRKGKMPIEARLDLHGLTQAQARTALTDFIHRTYEQNKRCVLVITGKGSPRTSDEPWYGRRPGVLRRCVPDWLSSSPLNDMVLKCVPARPKDGGDGALYVYLRRR